ncbi:hypothetical protein K7432_005196 [Basidiobolus ranarum]|uniref:Protein transport protein sec16 n=1 Tax=Basidiobolus ranarum TaxID=34480 RepID=A0ABR2WX13_9FUNG
MSTSDKRLNSKGEVEEGPIPFFGNASGDADLFGSLIRNQASSRPDDWQVHSSNDRKCIAPHDYSIVANAQLSPVKSFSSHHPTTGYSKTTELSTTLSSRSVGSYLNDPAYSHQNQRNQVPTQLSNTQHSTSKISEQYSQAGYQQRTEHPAINNTYPQQPEYPNDYDIYQQSAEKANRSHNSYHKQLYPQENIEQDMSVVSYYNDGNNSQNPNRVDFNVQYHHQEFTEENNYDNTLGYNYNSFQYDSASADYYQQYSHNPQHDEGYNQLVEQNMSSAFYSSNAHTQPILSSEGTSISPRKTEINSCSNNKDQHTYKDPAAFFELFPVNQGHTSTCSLNQPYNSLQNQTPPDSPAVALISSSEELTSVELDTQKCQLNTQNLHTFGSKTHLMKTNEHQERLGSDDEIIIYKDHSDMYETAEKCEVKQRVHDSSKEEGSESPFTKSFEKIEKKDLFEQTEDIDISDPSLFDTAAGMLSSFVGASRVSAKPKYPKSHHDQQRIFGLGESITENQEDLDDLVLGLALNSQDTASNEKRNASENDSPFGYDIIVGDEEISPNITSLPSDISESTPVSAEGSVIQLASDDMMEARSDTYSDFELKPKSLENSSAEFSPLSAEHNFMTDIETINHPSDIDNSNANVNRNNSQQRNRAVCTEVDGEEYLYLPKQSLVDDHDHLCESSQQWSTEAISHDSQLSYVALKSRIKMEEDTENKTNQGNNTTSNHCEQNYGDYIDDDDAYCDNYCYESQYNEQRKTATFEISQTLESYSSKIGKEVIAGQDFKHATQELLQNGNDFATNNNYGTRESNVSTTADPGNSIAKPYTEQIPSCGAEYPLHSYGNTFDHYQSDSERDRGKNQYQEAREYHFVDNSQPTVPDISSELLIEGTQALDQSPWEEVQNYYRGDSYTNTVSYYQQYSESNAAFSQNEIQNPSHSKVRSKQDEQIYDPNQGYYDQHIYPYHAASDRVKLGSDIQRLPEQRQVQAGASTTQHAYGGVSEYHTSGHNYESNYLYYNQQSHTPHGLDMNSQCRDTSTTQPTSGYVHEQPPMSYYNINAGHDNAGANSYYNNKDASSCKVNDPLGRSNGCPVVAFGFGGKLVLMFPQKVTRFSTSSSTPIAKIYPGELKFHKLGNIIQQKNPNRFPGPLLFDKEKSSVKSRKKSVAQFLDEKIKELSENSFGQTEDDGQDEVVLWKLLKTLCDHQGTLVGSSEVEKETLGTIFPVANRRRDNNRLGVNDNRKQHKAASPGALDSLQDLLLKGDRSEATAFAMENHLWAHALIIGSCVGKSTWQQVIQRFTLEELTSSSNSERESMAIMYNLFAGLGKNAIKDFIPESSVDYPSNLYTSAIPKSSPQLSEQLPRNSTSTAKLSKWRETVAMILANRTAGDSMALTSLGDLLRSHGWTNAAHVCYLLSPQSSIHSGVDTPSVKTVLFGVDHITYPSSFARDQDALDRTEIYEHAISLRPSSPVNGLPFLQSYKLHRAWYLSDLGFTDEALRYCEAITNIVEAHPKGSPYFHDLFLTKLKELHERLTKALGHKGTPSSASVHSWLTAMKTPTLGSLMDAVDRGLNRFIVGDSGITKPKSEVTQEITAGPFSIYDPPKDQGTRLIAQLPLDM